MQVELINQNTLAKRLNLSTATVSRSLRNHPDISPETRERVLQEAARLGYRLPEAQTTGLKSSLVLGAFMAQNASAHTTPVERMYMTGMSKAAQENNVLLFTHYLSGIGDERLLDPEHQPPIFRNGIIAGLALIHGYKPEVIAQLSQICPCVTITHNALSAQADHIDSDHETGMLDLLQHLVSLGHQRIGFIRWYSANFSISRFISFIKAHYLLGLRWDPKLEVLLNSENDVKDEGVLFEQVLAKTKEGVTAWVCDSDEHAYSVYRYLTRLGIKIPAQVSLAGYDNLPPFDLCPQMTTIAVPFVEMGRMAVLQLLARIQEPKMLPRKIVLHAEFINGLTTGPVPRS